MEQPVPFLVALAIVTVAVYTDTKRGLIPNHVTFPAMALGLVLHTVTGGWEGLGFSSQGLALGLGLLILPFLFGGMGAGDVKLLAAMGAFLGPEMVFRTFIYGALLGGAIAVLIIVRSRGWFSLFVALSGGWRGLIAARPVSSMGSFPYAAAMWFGLVAVNVL